MAGIKETLNSVPTVPTESINTKDVADTASPDYAGAQPKTNPAEIRLVRKLDYRIMVCAVPHSPSLSLNSHGRLHFVLNDVWTLAHFVVDVLLKLHRPRRARTGAPERLRDGSRHDGERLQRCCFDPCRRIRGDADPE